MIIPVAQCYSCEGRVIDEVMRHLNHFRDLQRNTSHGQRSVVFLASSGLGDQVSGFLAAIAFALLTGRRLEIPRKEGFFGEGLLETTFDSLPVDPSENRLGPFSKSIPNPQRNRWTLEEWLSRSRTVEADAGLTNMFFASPQLLMLDKANPGALHSRLNEIFDRGREYIEFGNTGYYAFALWLQKIVGRKNSQRARALAMGCTVRSLLRFAPEVKEIGAQYLPPRPYIGIHVRATRYLRGGIYGNDILDDRVFSCAPPVYHFNNFSDIWSVANSLEREISSEDQNWLLVSDSTSLKQSAKEHCGRKLWTTPIKPSHNEQSRRSVQCAHESTSRRLNSIPVERLILSELWLLSNANAIVHGESKYSTTAIFFCESCTRIVYLASCKERTNTVRTVCRNADKRKALAVGTHIRIDQLGGNAGSHYSNLQSY